MGGQVVILPERMTLEQKSQASEGSRYAGSMESLPGRGQCGCGGENKGEV